jgi:tRNA threonylcarbamoyl adenosine modification protein YeaZ
MNILALDTSGRHLSLALHTDKGLVLEINELVEDTVSERLPGLLQSHVEPWLEDLSKIDVLGVCHGPGPFTSIRIGLTVCKALIVRYKLAFCPIGSLMALARPYCGLGRDVVTLMDARRGEYYAAVYHSLAGENLERLAPCLILDREVIDWIHALPNRPLIVSQLPESGERILRDAGLEILHREPFLARDIVFLTKDRKKDWLHDSQALRPLYLREPDAVIGRSP